MKAKEMRKTRRIGLSTLTVALLGVAAAVFVIVGAFSFVAVYGQAMTADTSTRAEQATRQTAAALENYLHNMEEKLDRIAAEVTDESLTDTGELDVAVRLYTDVEAVMLWRRDGSLAVCSAGGRKVKTQAAGSLSFDARAFDSAEDFAISLPHVGNLYEDYYPWVVTLTRRMDPAVFGSDMAIAVDFSFSGIAQYIDNVGFGRHGYCYVIDRDGEMVYHPQQQMLYAGIREENVDEMTALEDGAHVFDDAILTALMWVIWNKTTFGKNMFAVGSNEEAANVSGVNVFLTIVLVFVLAGAMYGVTGFIEGARIASCSANTGLNYECDAIAACVIGGVSFVGGTGKISGIVIGVLLLQIIFAGLNFLSVSANMLYIIKGLIILIACAIDMRKYLVKK